MKSINELTEDIFYDSITDWKTASKNLVLPASVIRKYKNKVDWDYISQYQKLSEKFIEEFKATFYTYKLFDNICAFQKLSEKFIEEHSIILNWSKIGYGQKLSEKFIMKYFDKFYFPVLLIYQDLSENFLEKHMPYDEDEWCSISRHQKLTENFIIKYQDEINWDQLFKNEKIDFNSFSSDTKKWMSEKDFFQYLKE